MFGRANLAFNTLLPKLLHIKKKSNEKMRKVTTFNLKRVEKHI